MLIYIHYFVNSSQAVWCNLHKFVVPTFEAQRLQDHEYILYICTCSLTAGLAGWPGGPKVTTVTWLECKLVARFTTGMYNCRLWRLWLYRMWYVNVSVMHVCTCMMWLRFGGPLAHACVSDSLACVTNTQWPQVVAARGGFFTLYGNRLVCDVCTAVCVCVCVCVCMCVFMCVQH